MTCSATGLQTRHGARTRPLSVGAAGPRTSVAQAGQRGRAGALLHPQAEPPGPRRGSRLTDRGLFPMPQPRAPSAHRSSRAPRCRERARSLGRWLQQFRKPPGAEGTRILSEEGKSGDHRPPRESRAWEACSLEFTACKALCVTSRGPASGACWAPATAGRGLLSRHQEAR